MDATEKRIEGIKERVHQWPHLNPDSIFYKDDVSFLLSEIDRLKEEISKRPLKDCKNCSESIGKSTADEIWSRAIEIVEKNVSGDGLVCIDEITEALEVARKGE